MSVGAAKMMGRQRMKALSDGCSRYLAASGAIYGCHVWFSQIQAGEPGKSGQRGFWLLVCGVKIIIGSDYGKTIRQIRF